MGTSTAGRSPAAANPAVAADADQRARQELAALRGWIAGSAARLAAAAGAAAAAWLVLRGRRSRA